MQATFYKQISLPVAILLLMLSSLHLSCKKFVEIQPAPELIATDDIFASNQTAISACLGVYVQMRKSTLHFSNGGLSFFSALSADEIYNTAVSSIYDVFYNNSLSANTGTIYTNMWSIAYTNIYRINAIIEGLAKSTITDSLKRQLTGEMKVTRAFHYFYLVNLFGAVPLVTTSDYTINASLPRNSVEEIYQQMRSDLLDAQNLLKPAYPGTGKTRPNKWTASALLARVYLYQKDWANAEAQASSVINSGYSLVSNLNTVFLINSNETIWEMASPNEASNTAQGATFIPSSATVKPALALTNSLTGAFETGDQRKSNWVKSSIIGGTTYNYPNKYKTRSATPVTEYNIILRLAEQYLIRAEARAKQNNIAGAQTDINTIRNRAGLPAIFAGTETAILSAIDQERRVELFTEWGDRWLNLKRVQQADAVLSIVKGNNWQPTDVLYPLPEMELDKNPFLIQNPGY